MLRKKLILWLMETRLYSWLLLNVIPFIRFTTYYTSLRGWKYRKGFEKLRPGHIILAVDRKKLTTLLIKGDFSHAALCVGKNSDWEVSEMTHHHYTRSTFFDICKEADRILLLKCNDWDWEYTNKVITKCLTLTSAKYNTQFIFGIPALYCSELIYVSDVEKRLKVNIEDLAGLGRQYISPTGLYKAKNCSVVWDSDMEISAGWRF